LSRSHPRRRRVKISLLFKLLCIRGFRGCLLTSGVVDSYRTAAVHSTIKGQKLFIVLLGRQIHIAERSRVSFLLWTNTNVREGNSLRLHETPQIGNVCLIRKFADEAYKSSISTLALGAALFTEIKTRSLVVLGGEQASRLGALLFLGCYDIFYRRLPLH